MKICVCGWWLYQPFLDALWKVNKKYTVYIVSHRRDIKTRLPHFVTDNVGLEWEAYDFYTRFVWDGKSDVLFTHDDTAVSDLKVFDEIAAIKADCVFIFKTQDEAMDNGGRGVRGPMHGRAFKMSAGALKSLGGFWFDKTNTGITWKVEKGPDYNAGIIKFYEALKEKDIDYRWYVIPGYDCARRGRFLNGTRLEAVSGGSN